MEVGGSREKRGTKHNSWAWDLSDRTIKVPLTEIGKNVKN